MAASRIAGITVEIGGDTTKLTKALQGVDSEIKGTQTALKDIDRLLKYDPSSVQLLSQKHKDLKSEIGQTKDRLKTLQDAAKNSDLGAKEHDALQREIIETKQQLDKLKTEYREFGSVAKQEIQLAAGHVKDFGSKVGEVGDRISGFGKSLTAGITVPLVALGTKGAMSFAEVDKTMQLTNKTMGSTSEEAAILSQAMKDAAANSTYGMSDAATATLNFARAGLDAQEAADALAPAMNLAAGEGGNLDTVSAGLVATINGFHGAFSDAEKYADVFAAACNNSALDVDSLSSAMSVAAPIFASAGYSVNDAALYMGIMANNGIEADKAANSLKTGIARLISPAKEGAVMMEELGISVTNADGSMKSSVQIQQELHDAFSRLSESEQIAAASAIFGKNQMAPWLALINTAPEDVNALNDSLLNCSGTTQEMADTMMSGFGGSLEKLKSSIDVLVTSIGEALAPIISQAADIIQKLVDKFNALTPEQQEQVVQIGLLTAAIGPVIVIIGKVISGIGSVIQAGGMLMNCLSSLCSPVGLVVAAIAALVAIGVVLYQNWDEICVWAKEIWGRIKETVTNLVEGLKENLSNAWQAVKDAVSNAWNSIKDFFSQTWEGIKTVFTNALTGVKDRLTSAWNSVRETVSNVWNGIKNTLSGIWEGIKSVAGNAAENVRQRVGSAFENLKSAVQNIWENIKYAVQHPIEAARDLADRVAGNLRDRVTNAFENLKNAVANIWEGIKNAIMNPIEAARDFVAGTVDRIKSILSSVGDAVSGAVNGVRNFLGIGVSEPLSLEPVVHWNAAAMNRAVTFDRATVFGAAGGRLQGAGEAGREVLSGENHLIGLINSSVDSALGKRLDSVVGLLERYLPRAAEAKVAVPVDGIDGALSARAARRAAAW